jgi:ATP synthase protein I
MNPRPNEREEARPEGQADRIHRSARRKLEARRRGGRSPLYGLGMFGLVGWSIAIPTVLGTALGLWIDSRGGTGHSWTLAGLFGGVALGCFNAWYWVSRESRDED